MRLGRRRPERRAFPRAFDHSPFDQPLFRSARSISVPTQQSISTHPLVDLSQLDCVLFDDLRFVGTSCITKELRASNPGKMKGGDDGNEGFDLRRSLKIKVIDDTAVVEQVPVCEFRSMVKKEIGIRSGPKNQKEVDGEKGVDGKKVRRARRKAKSFRRSDQMLGNQENANSGSHKSEARRKRMYSTKEMEALRFVNVIEQRRFWRRVYDGLGPVAKDYVSLLSCYNKNYQYARPGSNFDCIRQSLRRERAPGILGVMAGSRRGNHHLNIFVPPNMIKTLYAANWSYVS